MRHLVCRCRKSLTKSKNSVFYIYTIQNLEYTRKCPFSNVQYLHRTITQKSEMQLGFAGFNQLTNASVRGKEVWEHRICKHFPARLPWYVLLKICVNVGLHLGLLCRHRKLWRITRRVEGKTLDTTHVRQLVDNVSQQRRLSTIISR